MLKAKRPTAEINSPHAHQVTTAIELLAFLDTAPRKYDDRAWTLAEFTIIDGKALPDRTSFGELI